ncbi:16S rRNA pseudouridine(516) synthase [Marinobacter nanhaiticus D15-8W]|uniref:Pseudouridine synthase n=1 Tax=Marinobacter nanhaiticus D15-8W TaxID=626887 RepID=N6WN95_9GAMM|nr:pseudouridine synthase [Marinobacter nanhaiticus]ENO12986.1 16S rRNA pseudouridine(516) synthase [Marinobacter nanhaiticus D15-8W]
MRLDRFICKQTGHSFRQARLLIAGGRVWVDGQPERNPVTTVERFMTISMDGTVLQEQTAHYLMLHKPVGYLSATRDPQHPTVLDLVAPQLRPVLHIGGRLDRSTSGLIILTNDGLWSRRLTEPREKIPKTYHVVTRDPISPETHQRFADGIYLAYERLTTSPARLEQVAEREARLTIYEGRYHQVKRMFAAVGNRVKSLHRESMGEIRLDPTLAPGEWRPLLDSEIASVI